jgi:hypothetical protein
MLGTMTTPEESETKATRTDGKTNGWWRLLLLLPYVGLVFPAFYAHATPTLMGFPFFYWYQFMWVILASAIMGVVYRKLKL